MTGGSLAGDAASVLVVLVLVATTVAALLAGAGVRVLLGRLRRGTRVGPGPCEAGVALAWLPPAGAVAGGAVDVVWAPLWAGVGVLAVAAGVTDAREHRLPDALTLPALPGALVLAAPLGGAAVVHAAVGAVVLLAAHAAVALAVPGALGGGDVKLAPALGAALSTGPEWALLAGPVLAALGVLGLALLRRRRAVPYGPPALASTWFVVGLAAVGPWTPT